MINIMKKINKNEPGMKSMKKMRKIQKKREKKMKSKKENKNIEEEKLLNEIAFDLSKKYSYTKLSGAIGGKSNFDVHGYLEKTYLNYEWLIEKMVLDRACFYSKKNITPETINMIKKLDIKNYVVNVLHASEIITHDNYPNHPWKKGILLASSSLAESITWQDNYPWCLESYDTYVSLGPANIALIKWIAWDIPVFLLMHAPGNKKSILPDVIINAKDMSKKTDDIQKGYIRNLRTVIEGDTSIIEESKVSAYRWKQRYFNYKNRRENNEVYDEEKEYKDFANPQKIKINLSKRTRKTIFWIFGILIAIGLIMWIFQAYIPEIIKEIYKNQIIPPDIFIGKSFLKIIKW